MFVKNKMQIFLGIAFVLLIINSCSKKNENIYCNKADLKVEIYWACENRGFFVLLKDELGKVYDPGGTYTLPEPFRPISPHDTVIAYVYLKEVEKGFCFTYPCAPCRNTEILCIKEL